MANWSDLKAAIAKVIKTNGNQEITGAVLQNALNNIISNVGENASFAGVATPSTNPGTPDGNVFYIASESGTYSNFDGTVNNGDCLIFKKNEDSWVSAETGIVTNKKLSDLLGLVIDTSTFVNGQWLNNGESLSSSNSSSYLRNSAPILISASPGTIISLYSDTGQRKRIADMGLTLKFRNKSKQDVSYSYVQSGQRIQLSAEASELYIHGTTESINNINGFSFLGFIFINSLVRDIAQNTQGIAQNTQGIAKNTQDIAKNTQGVAQNTRDIAQNTQDIEELQQTIIGDALPYLPCNTLEILLKHAYVGDTLGDNPISNATNNAYSRIDVSSVKNGTLLYLKNAENANIFTGVWKFFGSNGNRINATIGGTSGKDKGYLKPDGATVLGLHISTATITESNQEQWMKSLKIYGIPYTQAGFKGQISELAQKVEKNRNETEANIKDLNKKLESMEQHKDQQSYKEVLKVLFIGSSFGVDTVREVGNICASFGKNVILGNAYIGAAALDVFLKRFQANKGVTYYKWKYQATTWEQYNGTTGKWSSEPGSDITDEGDLVPANDTVLMDWLLADEAWDFIIMQNGAYQSPYEDQSSFWEKGKDGQITRNIVQELIDMCKKACLYSNPVFCMNMTWAFSIYHTISESHGPSGANDDHWSSYGNNQKERQLGMWRNIVKNYKDCISNCPDVKFIIPSGTAVQNARTITQLRQSTNYASASPAIPTIQEAEAITDLTAVSDTYPFMNNVANWRNKNDFTRDSIHANFGITRYLVAATLFQSFMAKIYNLDIADCSYRISQGVGDYREQLCTPVTNDNFNDIVACVKNAILKPYEITA